MYTSREKQRSIYVGGPDKYTDKMLVVMIVSLCLPSGQSQKSVPEKSSSTKKVKRIEMLGECRKV